MSSRIPDGRAPADSPRRRESASAFRARLARIAPVLILAVIVVISLVIAYALITRQDQPVVVEGSRSRAIQLDVRNGTGVTGLAQRVTSYLRSKGFDVVEIGNTDTTGLARTLVLDRSGNIEAARRVATALGLDDSHVEVRIDRTLYLDVSVHLGDDLSSFSPSR